MKYNKQDNTLTNVKHLIQLTEGFRISYLLSMVSFFMLYYVMPDTTYHNVIIVTLLICGLLLCVTLFKNYALYPFVTLL